MLQAPSVLLGTEGYGEGEGKVQAGGTVRRTVQEEECGAGFQRELGEGRSKQRAGP